MRGSYATKRHFDALMRGWNLDDTGVNNASALDYFYDTGVKLGAFQSMLEIDWVLDDLLTNALPLNVICRTSDILGMMLNLDRVRAYLTAGSTFLTALEAQVNRSDSFLKRDTFNASGTWTYPATTGIYSSGVHALQVVTLGPAGTAAAAASPRSGGGGAGGQLKVDQIAELSLPTANVTVTLPAAGSGSPSTFGSLTSAAAGANAINTAGGVAAGGGSTVNSSYFNTTGLDSVPWHIGSCSIKGGDGGQSVASAANGSDGTAGASGSGGAGSTADTTPAGAGTGLGSGGGSGRSSATAAAAASGASATANTGCGAGGGNRTATGTPALGSAGTSAIGTVRALYVRKRA